MVPSRYNYRCVREKLIEQQQLSTLVTDDESLLSVIEACASGITCFLRDEPNEWVPQWLSEIAVV